MLAAAAAAALNPVWRGWRIDWYVTWLICVVAKHYRQ